MRRLIILIFLVFMAVKPVYAVDVTIGDLTPDANPTADDLIETENNPGGTPGSRKVTLGNAAKAMTSTNFVDTANIGYLNQNEIISASNTWEVAGTLDISGTLDLTNGDIKGLTSAKLADALSNETGTGSVVFSNSPTLVTPVLGTIASGVGTALTALNGENIQNDTIDDDSIDFGTGTDQVSASDMPNEDLGDISISSGVWSIDANSVAFGTDTIGDYVDGVQANQGLQKSGTEGADLGLIPCTDGQVLKNSGGTAWQCAADNNDGGGGSGFAPADATYLTLTSNGTLSAEVAVGVVDDSVIVGNGSTMQAKVLSDCDGNGSAMNYDTTTNAFSCKTLADADIPNTITVDLATLATTATTANNLGADGVDALTEIAQGIKTAANDTSKLVVGTAGSTNDCAKWDSSGALVSAGAACGSGGGGSVSGSDTWVQYNMEGTFGSEADFTYNDATNTMTVAGTIQAQVFETTGGGDAILSTTGSFDVGGTTHEKLHLDFTGTNILTATSTTGLATINFSSIALQESGVGVVNLGEIDTYSELNTIVSGVTLTHNGLIDTYSELNTIVADATLTHNGLIDTFAEIDAIVADKALVNKADGAVWLGVHDFGGATVEIPNGTSGTTTTTGRVYLDTDGDGGTNFSGPLIQLSTNGSTLGYLFPIAALPQAGSQDNYIMKYDASGKTIQFEVDTSTAGGEGSVTAQEEGSDVVTSGTFNFVGSGVTVTDVGGVATVTISGGSGAFSDASDPVVLNTTTKDVAIGSALINSAKLSIDNEANQVAFAIQGHSTQSANIMEVENSGGTVTFSINQSGVFPVWHGGFLGDSDAISFDNVLVYGSGNDLTVDGTLIPTALMIPNSTTLPATCTVGEVYDDTNATSGSRLYLCESTNTWAVVGGGGGGGGSSTQSIVISPASMFITGTIALTGDATQGAQVDASNGGALLFDDTTDEGAGWRGKLPSNWSAHGSLKLNYSMTSATANEVEWEAAVMCVTPGVDSIRDDADSFAAFAVASDTVPGTVRFEDTVSITLTDDSCAAGDDIQINISTDADDATNDDATGDRRLIGVVYEYTAS